ncbi:collagen alpha-2(I) chain-like [Phocoena phocoena]|uniref:collagen alpha-2(I) chain-like n=1 Tax=Phocoena phocoena TaxID=9742 RepID=UPI003307A35C
MLDEESSSHETRPEIRNHPDGDSRIAPPAAKGLSFAGPSCGQAVRSNRLPQQPPPGSRGAPPGPRRLPAAGAWEGGGALSQTSTQAPGEPLEGPHPAPPGCAGGRGPAPAPHRGVQTPSQEGSDWCPGPSGATGSQGRAGAPSVAAATSSLAGPVITPRRAPEQPSARAGPRPHLRRGPSRGRALRLRWRSAPGAAARGRVLPRAFPAAGHVLGAPEGAGCSPASCANWLGLRRELPGRRRRCRRCRRRSRPPPAFAAAAAAQQPGSARPRAPPGTAQLPPSYRGWVSRAKLRVFAPQSRGSTMTPRQHHTVISAAAEGGEKKAILTKRGMGWGRTGLGLPPRGSSGKGPAARCSATFPGSPSATPAAPSSPCPSSGGAFTCFLPWQE